MTEKSKISFQEKQEPGFLERLLLSRRWDFASALLFFCAAISVGLALFHLFTAVYGTPEGRSFRSVHLSVMLTLAIFMKPLFRSSMYDPVWVDGDARNNLRALGLGIDLALVGLILSGLTLLKSLRHLIMQKSRLWRGLPFCWMSFV